MGYGGRRSSSRNPSRGTHVSRMLVKILRHTADDLGLFVSLDGFCRVADVLASKPLKPLNVTLEEVLQAVRSNAKRRFDVRQDSGEWYVRAVQGHSMKIVDDASLL